MMFASDLDRTLIYSKRAFLLNQGESADVQLIETLEGKEISFMTHHAIKQLKQLMDSITFVPVTTRTTEQYNRITVFPEEIKQEYAVTSNGANVLKKGQIDEDWSRFIANALTNECLPIPDVLKTFNEIGNEKWVLRTRTAESFFIYHIIEADHIPMNEILQFESWLTEQNWCLSLQGRKLYFVPKAINKAAAVKYIQDMTGKKTLIAAGDSKLDLPLLEAADYAFCPQHGELHKTLDPGKITITKAKGIKASEEILESVMGIQVGAF